MTKVSTEASVRTAHVTAIRKIARTKLGFDEPEGNVKDYLLEHEQPENVARYLKSVCGGRKVVRCWAVQVLAAEEIWRTAATWSRTYAVSVRGYYSMGYHGAGVRLLVDHARAVRGAVYELGSTLGGLVTQLERVDPLDIRVIPGIDAEDNYLLEGEIHYRYLAQEVSFEI